MTTLKARKARLVTLGDLLERLGGISPDRVRLTPPPGRASERDLVRVLNHDPEGRLYELIHGTLVEKAMGAKESIVACYIIGIVQPFVRALDLGFLMGADGAVRIMPGIVYMPDVTFVRWSKLPRREIPDDAVLGLVPDLVIEVLSKGNTRKEMARKLGHYFQCGVERVWYVDPKRRTVEDFSSPTDRLLLTEDDTLDGGAVLPGLRIPLKTLFADFPAQKSSKRQPPKGKK